MLWKLHKVHNKTPSIESLRYLSKALKETPTKTFLYEICKIICFSSIVLESLVTFRQAWIFFLDVKVSIKKHFLRNYGKFIYFSLMFQQIFQQKKSAVIKRYKKFFYFTP